MNVREAKQIITDFLTNLCTDVFITHKRIHNICPAEMARLTDAYTEYMVVKTLAMDKGTLVNGGMKLSASAKVDELWHTHLLFTENYQMFMKCITRINPLVKFIHHSLKGSFDCEDKKSRRRQATVTAYKKLFGKDCSWMKEGEHSFQNEMNNEGIKEGENSIKDEMKTEGRGPGTDFHILILDLNGRKTPLHLGSSWRSSTILEVKKAIHSVLDIPPARQQLFIQRRAVKDYHTLADYNVKKHSYIHLVQNLRGC